MHLERGAVGSSRSVEFLKFLIEGNRARPGSLGSERLSDGLRLAQDLINRDDGAGQRERGEDSSGSDFHGSNCRCLRELKKMLMRIDCAPEVTEAAGLSRGRPLAKAADLCGTSRTRRRRLPPRTESRSPPLLTRHEGWRKQQPRRRSTS